MKKESEMLPIIISLIPSIFWFFIIYVVALSDVNIINYVVTIAIWLGSGLLLYAYMKKRNKDLETMPIATIVYNVLVLVGLYYLNR